MQGSISEQFKAIDENGDGGIAFDEWLVFLPAAFLLTQPPQGFAYKNYQAHAKSLPVAFDQADKDTFVADCKNVSRGWGRAVKCK